MFDILVYYGKAGSRDDSNSRIASSYRDARNDRKVNNCRYASNIRDANNSKEPQINRDNGRAESNNRDAK